MVATMPAQPARVWLAITAVALSITAAGAESSFSSEFKKPLQDGNASAIANRHLAKYSGYAGIGPGPRRVVPAECGIDGCLFCDNATSSCAFCEAPFALSRGVPGTCVLKCPFGEEKFLVTTLVINAVSLPDYRCGIPGTTVCKAKNGCFCGDNCEQCLFPEVGPDVLPNILPPVDERIVDSCTKCAKGFFRVRGTCSRTMRCTKGVKEGVDLKEGVTFKRRFYDENLQRCSCGDPDCASCILTKGEPPNCLGCTKNLYRKQTALRPAASCVQAADCFPDMFPVVTLSFNRVCFGEPVANFYTTRNSRAVCDMGDAKLGVISQAVDDVSSATPAQVQPCACVDSRHCRRCEFTRDNVTNEAAQTCLECVGRWLQSGKCRNKCDRGFAHVLGPNKQKFCSPKRLICRDGRTVTGQSCACAKNVRSCEYLVDNSARAKGISNILECYPGFKPAANHCKAGRA